MKTAQPPQGFTGRHMLLTMLAFFGVIIAVNVAMAVVARTSWTGLVVANSYVASQEFNAKMAETRAMAALHWTGRLAYDGKVVRYRLSDAKGQPVRLRAVAITLRRPVDDREDRTIDLEPDAAGGFSVEHAVAEGVWLVEIDADAGLASLYRETRRIHIRNGVLQ